MVEYKIIVSVSSKKEGLAVHQIKRKLSLRVLPHNYKNLDIYKELARAIDLSNIDSSNYSEFFKYIGEDISYLYDKQLDSYYNYIKGLSSSLNGIFQVPTDYYISSKQLSMAYSTNFSRWYSVTCFRERIVVKDTMRKEI